MFLSSIVIIAVNAQDSEGLDITVNVSGLEDDDMAVLQLLPNSRETAEAIANAGITLPELTVQNGDVKIQVPSIPNGIYKLTVEAPPAYFREPGGYFFNLLDGQIVRRTDGGYSLQFELQAPSVQNYVPCRYFLELNVASPSKSQSEDNSRVANCMSEHIIDLSGPPKQPEQSE